MTHGQRTHNDEFEVSIIVATYNRAPSLARFLASVDSLAGLDSTTIEVLVVDNDSTDDTAKLLIEEQRKPRKFLLRALRETERGRASTINCGLRACRGEIICLMDDDVVLDRNWLTGLLHSYGTSAFAAFQGKVLPGVDPSGKPPDPKKLYEYNITIIDRGDRIKETNGMVGVCSFRRAVFEKLGFLDQRLGVGASGFGEDTDFSRRVRAAGLKIGYTPHAVVYHELDPNRYGGRYNRRVRYRMGLSESLYLDQPLLLNVLPNFIKYSLRWLFYRASCQRRRAYKAEGRLVKCWGYLIGRLKQKGWA
ncbi:MAG: glycosyltransferase family 2 protein [Candidatus Binatia bacterium]